MVPMNHIHFENIKVLKRPVMASNEIPIVPIQKTPADNPNEVPPMITPDQFQQKVLTKEDVSSSPQRPNKNPTVSSDSIQVDSIDPASEEELNQTTPTDNPNQATPMAIPDPAQQPVLKKEDAPVTASNENRTVLLDSKVLKSNEQSMKEEPTKTRKADNPNEAPPLQSPDPAPPSEFTGRVSPSPERPVMASNEHTTVLSDSKDFESIELSSEDVPTQTRETDDSNNDSPINDPEPTPQPLLTEGKSSFHERLINASEENPSVSPASRDSFDQSSKDEPIQIKNTDNANQVPPLKGPGFVLGNTIESTTKGIWVWCKDHPEQKDTVLMLLDTEGLGDVEKGDPNHDNRIFTLATLLCSTLVYNMMGAFDQDAVNKLTFVSEMAKNVKFGGKCDENNSLLQCVLPGFVLALRDFSLKLIKDGRKITEDEYLEICLESKKGKTALFNKPRECIRKFFQKGKRRCFAFPRPGDEDVLENIESLTFQDLSPNFQKATTNFLSFIYSQESKQLEVSKPVNGSMFATLTRNYVDALAKGAVPDVDDAFATVAKIENQRVKEECMNMFRSKMKELQLPQPSKLLDIHFTETRWTALEYMRTKAIKDVANVVERNAQMEMDLFWQQFQRQNEEELEKHCENILVGLESIKNLFATLKTEGYYILGGHKKFKRDVETARQQYEKALFHYEPREVGLCWSSFANQLGQEENKILEKDDALSVEEKKKEKEENADSLKRIKIEMAEDNQKALDKQKKEMDEQQMKLNAERERRDKEHEDKVEDLQKKIASLETSKEDQNKLLNQIAALQEESRRQKEEANNKLEEMQRHEYQKRKYLEEKLSIEKGQWEKEKRKFEEKHRREKEKREEANRKHEENRLSETIKWEEENRKHEERHRREEEKLEETKRKYEEKLTNEKETFDEEKRKHEEKLRSEKEKRKEEKRKQEEKLTSEKEAWEEKNKKHEEMLRSLQKTWEEKKRKHKDMLSSEREKLEETNRNHEEKRRTETESWEEQVRKHELNLIREKEIFEEKIKKQSEKLRTEKEKRKDQKRQHEEKLKLENKTREEENRKHEKKLKLTKEKLKELEKKNQERKENSILYKLFQSFWNN
ncbi:GBP1-like protein [Mya arenaria]|uniref:GBP1-like protein n=1 Tax=Mya arenaria TaxID=6604 RepID=A0ABY7EUV4_MYAAR|nr:GBP1-like protein [Mya arenaria]